MVRLAVATRADQRKLVGQFGLPWQQLAEVHAGDTRANRAEGAAKLDRRLRFQIVGVQVARTAIQPNQDTGRVAPRATSGRGLVLQSQQVWQLQCAETGHGGLQEWASPQPSRVRGVVSHDRSLPVLGLFANVATVVL